MKEGSQELEKPRRTENAVSEPLDDLKAPEEEKWADTVERAAVSIVNDGIPDNMVPTGYPHLAYCIKGFRNTDMIVLAARTAMGKTSLAMNIAERVALGHPGGKRYSVGIFCFQKSREEYAKRMIFSKAEVPVWKDFFSESEQQKLSLAAEQLKTISIIVEDPPWLDLADLCARARSMKKNSGIDLLIIDSLQQLGDSRNASAGRKQELGAVSEGVKALALELKIPVLLLSNLSRAPERGSRDGTPRLSDLHDLGDIDRHADVVMLLLRPSYYRNRGEADYDDTLAIIDVPKNRNGGTSKVRMTFLRDVQRFEDRTHDDDRRAEALKVALTPKPVRAKRKPKPKADPQPNCLKLC